MASKSPAERLVTLQAYDILDTFPEPPFERLTRLAASIFDVPIALISLIDENRQWFKSHLGLQVCETPLNVSFCRFAIEGDTVFHVGDATQDARFKANALVTGEPGIRFYAGAPLHTPDGNKIGTLCVIDTVPRKSFRAKEQQILQDLAALVVDELELRKLKDGNGVARLEPVS